MGGDAETCRGGSANCAGAGVRNLRRRRLRLGNRSYLQQLIEQKSGRWVWEAPKEGVCVVTLSVVPEGLAAASAAVEALTARLAAAHAGAAPAITAVVAPAADPVSLQSAVGFSALGSEHAAIAGEGVEELGRSGVAVGESGIGYAAGDAVAAATYLVSGGSL